MKKKTEFCEDVAIFQLKRTQLFLNSHLKLENL